MYIAPMSTGAGQTVRLVSECSATSSDRQLSEENVPTVPKAEDAGGPELEGPGGTIPGGLDATCVARFTAKRRQSAISYYDGTAGPCGMNVPTRPRPSSTQAVPLCKYSIVQRRTTQPRAVKHATRPYEKN